MVAIIEFWRHTQQGSHYQHFHISKQVLTRNTCCAFWQSCLLRFMLTAQVIFLSFISTLGRLGTFLTVIYILPGSIPSGYMREKGFPDGACMCTTKFDIV